MVLSLKEPLQGLFFFLFCFDTSAKLFPAESTFEFTLSSVLTEAGCTVGNPTDEIRVNDL